MEKIFFTVAYASKQLLPREQRYSTIEKTKIQNLYGKQFILQTDHKLLSYAHVNKGSNSRVLRWALFLQNFKFGVEYIKGVDNVTADYLSRST